MSSTTLRARKGCPLTSRLPAGVLHAAADARVQFAAGRAAVKPACRFRQARGLRRRSEYGSSVQSQTPAGALTSPAGVFPLLPMQAGSVSERKPLGNKTRPSPAFFAGAPYWFLDQPPAFPSQPLREERERKACPLKFNLLCVIRRRSTRVVQPWSNLTWQPCVSGPRNSSGCEHWISRE